MTGRIITFYSYKGGTGRSMALANIAWILASNGHRVLALDWDLEAPGLHRYFSPFLEDKELAHTQGIIDIVHEFAVQALTDFVPPSADSAQAPDAASPQPQTAPPAWFDDLADISRYAVSVQYPGFTEGTLDIVPAGIQDSGYATRCNTFDWGRFYENLNGYAFLEALRASMRAEYDYVLIDSRTGVSDTSGICTIQLPDDVVICFTLNNQSIDGATAVARSVQSQRRRAQGDSPVRILPVPMRLETSEKTKLDERMKLARARFDGFIGGAIEEKDTYWKEVSVPYWPFYSFEEILAVFGDSPGGVNTLLNAYERIAGRIVLHPIALVAPSERHRRIVQAAFAGETKGPVHWASPRLFISYASPDGTGLAEQLRRDFLARGLDVWLDTKSPRPGSAWTTDLEEAIDRADVLIVLLTPDAYSSEICRAGQIRALRNGKCVIPILAAAGAAIPLYLESNHYHNFTQEASYAANLQALLGDIEARNGVPLPPTPRATPTIYINAPTTVANYVDRPEAVRALRDTLFGVDERRAIALTALQGMAGIGKTVLAQALLRDEVVRDAFPDGLFWIAVGREPSQQLAARLREITSALGGAIDDSVAPEILYRTAIAGKATLIVLDDVWSKADLDPFLAESPRSRFLFTTRDAGIARFAGAREHTVDLLDAAQSRELLAAWAGVEIAQLPPAANDVLRECGSLPLALSTMGALLRGAAPGEWAEIARLLRNADLAAIEEQLPPGQMSIFRAIDVSVKALAPQMQRQYAGLAVLLEDMPAPLPVLETLWSVDAAEARRIGRRLADRSLAQWDPDGDSIRIHDLQLDYLRSQHPDPKALELIHGAVRLSTHVVDRDPRQFASQILGRLLPCREVSGIRRFLDEIASAAPLPWLRPLYPALQPPGTTLMRTLDGHSVCVSGVAVTADGRRAVSASWDKTLKVWDLATGRALHTLEGHSASVDGVAVTADGKRIVSASGDHSLKVWDLESGQALRTLEGHSASVAGVALTPDGKRVVSASADNLLKVWDLESGQMLLTMDGHADAVCGVAVTPDGKRAVSASRDTTLKVWDLETGRALRTLEGHSDAVSSVAVSADGKHAVSTSLDSTLRIWDLKSGRAVRTLKGHSASVYAVAVTQDGKRAVSGSGDNTLKVWDLEAGRVLATLEGHSGFVAGVAVTADGKRAVSTSFDSTLKEWDLDRSPSLGTMQAHSASVEALAVAPDGKRAVSASWDKTLKVWDLESGRVLRALEGHSGFVSGVAVTADGKRGVSASRDKTLKVWDLETGLTLLTLEGHDDFVTGVALTPDGSRVISSSWDKTLKTWDLETGSVLDTLKGHRADVNAVAITPSGLRAVSGSADKTLKVWDLGRGVEMRTLEGHTDSVISVAVTADGKRAVSGSADKTLKVWDLEIGRALRTLEGHADSVSGIALSADGRRAISASWDNTLKIWDLDAGEIIATFYCDAPALCCAFADRQHIVAGDDGGGVYFLSLEERR